MEPKKLMIVKIVLLMTIIISIILIFLISINSTIDDHFQVYDFYSYSKTNNLSSLAGLDIFVAHLRLINHNKYLPIRVELFDIFICMFDKETNELIFSRDIYLVDDLHTTQYGTFSDTKFQFIDIRPQQRVDLQYGVFFGARNIDEMIKLIEDNQVEVIYKKSLDRPIFSHNSRQVCLNQTKSIEINAGSIRLLD